MILAVYLTVVIVRASTAAGFFIVHANGGGKQVVLSPQQSTSFEVLSPGLGWQWMYVQFHTQRQFIQLMSNSTSDPVEIRPNVALFLPGRGNIGMLLHNPGKRVVSPPVRGILTAFTYASAVVPGGCGEAGTDSTLHVMIDGNITFIDLQRASADTSRCVVDNNLQYRLYARTISGPSEEDMFDALRLMYQPQQGADIRVNGSSERFSNGTIRFTVQTAGRNGVVFNVGVSQTKQVEVFYVPAVSYRCALASLDNNTCNGVLKPDKATTVPLSGGNNQSFVLGIPLKVDDNHTIANTAAFTVLQAHSQRNGIKAFANSPWESNDKVVFGRHIAFYDQLFNSSGAVRDQAAIRVHTENNGVQVQVFATTYPLNAPIPGGCNRTCFGLTGIDCVDATVRMDSSISSSKITFARAQAFGVKTCVVSQPSLLYMVYRLTINDSFSIENYQASMEHMQTVDDISEYGVLVGNVTGSGVMGDLSMSFQAEEGVGDIYNVIVLDQKLGTAAAYTAVASYHCYSPVSQKVQYGSPCKVLLQPGVPRMVDLGQSQAMSFLANASFGAKQPSGFVVIQAHAQLHRLSAAYQLNPPSSAATLTSRSTGLVAPQSASGTEFYLNTFSVVATNAMVMAITYTPSYPIPGGCCPNCSRQGVPLDWHDANPVVNVTFNDTHSTLFFYDALININNKYVCASTVKVIYSVYEVVMNDSHSETSMFSAVRKMYHADGMPGTKLVDIKADRYKYTFSQKVQPGVGRVFAVVAVYSVNGKTYKTAYVPATTYDCSYTASTEDNGAICKGVLQPRTAYQLQINAKHNLSFVLNDWQPRATKWTFAVLNVHSQRHDVESSLSFPATLSTTTRSTNDGLVALLDPTGGNDQTFLYVSRRLAGQSSALANEKVNIQVQAITYNYSVPIPGGCCLTCSLDVDPNLNVTYTLHQTRIAFAPANVGFEAPQKTPFSCNSKDPILHDRLNYYIYKYDLGYASFSEKDMFAALSKMSTVEGVLKNGGKVSLPTTTYKDMQSLQLLSRQGQGVVYNVLVMDPDNKTRSVYSPFVTYSCSFSAKINSCESMGSLAVKIPICIAGVVGLVFVFFGHGLFKGELFAIGLLLAAFLAYTLLSIYTNLDYTYRIVTSLSIGVIFGLTLLALWWYWDRAIFFQLWIGLAFGFMTGSLLFFTPFGNMRIWHVTFNYWMAFLCAVLIHPTLVLLMPLHMNILATAFLGGYAVVMAVDQFVYTSLSYIILDVLLHAVEPANYTKYDYHAYVFGPSDIGLSALWLGLVIIGCIFQLVMHRRSGRPDFPPCPTSRRRSGYSRVGESLSNGSVSSVNADPPRQRRFFRGFRSQKPEQQQLVRTARNPSHRQYGSTDVNSPTSPTPMSPTFS